MVPPKGITWLFLCPDITISYQSQAGKEMKIMSYIPPSVVQEVKRMDLLTYLKNWGCRLMAVLNRGRHMTRTESYASPENLSIKREKGG